MAKKVIKNEKIVEKQPEIIQKVEEIKELTERERAVQDARNWYIKLKGRRSANQPELQQLFQWYRIITGKDGGSTTCGPCVSHVYNVVKMNVGPLENDCCN